MFFQYKSSNLSEQPKEITLLVLTGSFHKNTFAILICINILLSMMKSI